LRRSGELVFELFGSEYDFLKEVMPFLRLVLGFYFYLLWQDDILSLSWERARQQTERKRYRHT
jgi:hypothetical protein